MSKPLNISASRGAAVLGVSSWKTQVQAFLEIMGKEWCELHGYEFPVVEESPAMRWGKAFESSIIELAENNKPTWKIICREKLFKHKEYNYITCHIDGQYDQAHLITPNPDLHEGKTSSFFYWKDNFGEPGTDAVPIEYQVQAQHEFICTGAEKEILSVLVFPKRVEEWELNGWEIIIKEKIYWLKKDDITTTPIHWAQSLADMGYFHQYEIKSNPELQSRMINIYSDFWNNHILPGIPPEPYNIDDILLLNPVQTGTVVLDAEALEIYGEYKKFKLDISENEKKAEDAKKLLLLYCAQNKVNDTDDKKWIAKDSSGNKIFSYSKRGGLR